MANTSIRDAQKRAEIKRVEEAKKLANKNLANFIGKRLPDEVKGGDILPLKIYPNPALTTLCENVVDFNPDLRKLIQSLGTTMYMTGGVGLAANQVGILQRIFVCDVRANLKGAKSEFRVFINPCIVEASDELETQIEGCLSFPGAHEGIERPKAVKVRAHASNGLPFEAVLEGWEARVFLHEFDHLEGITWLDYMKPMARKMALKKVKKVKRSIELDELVSAKRQKMRTRRR